jgi:hypothetical protein
MSTLGFLFMGLVMIAPATLSSVNMSNQNEQSIRLWAQLPVELALSEVPRSESNNDSDSNHKIEENPQSNPNTKKPQESNPNKKKPRAYR